ncbi:hypothetical protein [Xenorhabdus bovienii]|uniref:transcriptional antitermination N peptide n=1 Tax=Xenorhabdus bovienii TaxID=40576 RepID=UPI0023B2C2B5|nr:hypothetical protein [Xenorhabdus bovienii]MDE9467482.1 hypothetical protein [Xenorhabdus bovienii]MDE9484130.1 hypothetical protein [Xenorhabdus bovienii]MDE9549346.1 hypothetical protein [Xenorhabdus bovienii]
MNFHGYNNTRQRRHERRKTAQEAYNQANGINPEEITKPIRPTLYLKRQSMDRVEKAVSVQETPVIDNFNNTCLPNVALYSTKQRASNRILESGGVTARV